MDYSTRRSFRREATSRAEIIGLSETVTNLNNRWRSAEKAKARSINHHLSSHAELSTWVSDCCLSRCLSFRKRRNLELPADWGTQVTAKVAIYFKGLGAKGGGLLEPSRHGVSGLHARLVHFQGLVTHSINRQCSRTGSPTSQLCA